MITDNLEAFPDLTIVNTALIAIPIGCILFFILQRKGIIKTGPKYNNKLAMIIAAVAIIATAAINIMVTNSYKESYARIINMEFSSDNSKFGMMSFDNMLFGVITTEIPGKKDGSMLCQIPLEKITYHGEIPENIIKRAGSDTIFTPARVYIMEIPKVVFKPTDSDTVLSPGGVYVIKKQFTIF